MTEKEAGSLTVCLLYQVKLFLHKNVLEPKCLNQKSSLGQSLAHRYAQRWSCVSHIRHLVCVNTTYFSYALEAWLLAAVSLSTQGHKLTVWKRHHMLTLSLLSHVTLSKALTF